MPGDRCQWRILASETGVVVFRIVVVSWGKGIAGLNPNTAEDNMRYATRPVWTIQPNTRRKNATVCYRDLSGRRSKAHRLLKHRPMRHFSQGCMLTRPNVLSNQILRLHANIAIGETRGGTYGVWGEKRTWYRVGYLRLDVNERDIEEFGFGCVEDGQVAVRENLISGMTPNRSVLYMFPLFFLGRFVSPPNMLATRDITDNMNCDQIQPPKPNDVVVEHVPSREPAPLCLKLIPLDR